MQTESIPATNLSAAVLLLRQGFPDLDELKLVQALKVFDGGSAPEALLPPKRVAEACGVSVWTVKRLLKRGKLPGVRVGVQWRVPAEALRSLAVGDATGRRAGA